MEADSLGNDFTEGRSSNVEASNPILLDDKEAEKLKGDAIGSTVYSESGLLKTLILLSKQTNDSWSEQLEEQLCVLWDMTFEDDVIAVLIEHDFVNLACHVIQVSSEPRLIELLVGILGNMTALKDVRRSLSQSNAAELLLSLLSSSDTPCLLQLMRLLNSCVWHINKNSHTSVNEDEDEHSESQMEAEAWVKLLKSAATSLNENLSFILRSSTSEELLQSTLELLNNLCCISSKNHYFSELLATEEMLEGLSEALLQLLNSDGDAESILWGEKAEKAAHLWSQTLSTFTLHNPGIHLLYNQRKMIMRSMCCIFDPLCFQENILPLNSNKLEILDSMMDVLECLEKKHCYSPPAITPRMLTIIALISPMEENCRGDIERKNGGREEENVEKYADVLQRIQMYCLSILSTLETELFLEAFGEAPIPKVNLLLSNLSKCSPCSCILNIVEILKGHLS